jgi:hypothetical protein
VLQSELLDAVEDDEEEYVAKEDLHRSFEAVPDEAEKINKSLD